MKHLLFVCTLNQIRSLTAESILKKDSRWEVRSAGTASNARVPVSSSLIRWADTIFVMEREHKNILVQKFPDEMKEKNVIILDIPDRYNYMDEELVTELQNQISLYI